MRISTSQWSEWWRADAVCEFVRRGPPPSLTSGVRLNRRLDCLQELEMARMTE